MRTRSLQRASMALSSSAYRSFVLAARGRSARTSTAVPRGPNRRERARKTDAPGHRRLDRPAFLGMTAHSGCNHGWERKRWSLAGRLGSYISRRAARPAAGIQDEMFSACPRYERLID